MKKVIHLKDGGTMIFQKRGSKTISVSAGFFVGNNREKYAEPTMHFCEHMLFKETEKYTRPALEKAQSEIFSSVNAGTSPTTLIMHFSRTKEALRPCLELSSEMLLHTKFSKANIESEKGVIKQELVRRNNDSGYYLWNTLNNIMRKDTPMTSVLGSEKEIDAVKAADLKKFRDECFIRQNFVCSVSGKISLWRAKHMIYKYYYSQIKSNPSYPVERTYFPPISRTGSMKITHFPFTKVMGKIVVKLDFSYKDLKNCCTSRMLSWVFNGIGSKMFTALRNEGLVYTCRVGRAINGSDCCMSIYFESSPENVNKIFEKIGQLLKDMATHDMDAENFENLKKNAIYAEKEGYTNPKNRAQNNLFDYLNFQDPFIWSKKAARKSKKLFKKVTPQDFRLFIKNAFSKPENIYVALVTGEEKPNFYSYDKILDLLVIK